MKLRWGKAGSRAKKASSETMPSPDAGKGDRRNGGNSTAGGSASEVHEDDVFFDPRPWPVSDGEDDFFSVNGELTPTRVSTPSRSCDSTPNHQHSQSLSPRVAAATASNNGDSGGAPSTDPDAQPKPEEEATPKTRFGGLIKRTGKRGAGAGGGPVVPASNGNGGGGSPPKCSGDGGGGGPVVPATNSNNRSGLPPKSRCGSSRTRTSTGGGMGLQCCIPGLGCSKRRQKHAVENAAVP